MGRTQSTYRRRLQAIQDNLLKISSYGREEYKNLWETAQKLSAPASTMPYPDTHAVVTFTMILDAIAELSKIEKEINHLD